VCFSSYNCGTVYNAVAVTLNCNLFVGEEILFLKTRPCEWHFDINQLRKE